MRMNTGLLPCTEATLVKLIDNAKEFISFLGCGLTKLEAEALVKNRDRVKYIVVDINDESFYNGYSSAEALSILHNAGITIFQGNKFRINILDIDNKAIIYSPIPQSIEKLPDGEYPNGIYTDYITVKNLFDGINQNFSYVQDNKNENELSYKITEVNDDDIKKIEKKYPNENEKLKYKQILNIYKSKIQFIEPRLTGFNFKSRTITIPSDLLKLNTNQDYLSQNDKESIKNTQEKLKAKYSLFTEYEKDKDKKSNFNTQVEAIQELVAAFRKNHVVNIKKYGNICCIDEKQAIE